MITLTKKPNFDQSRSLDQKQNLRYKKRAMFWAILTSITVVALAYLIKSFANEVFEFRNSFFAIIGLFLILYIGAAIFVNYSLKQADAKKISPGQFDDQAYVIDQPIQELDLSTGP